MNAPPIRFGILGCGNVAERHAECITALDEARLVAVADRIPERAESLGARHGVETVSGAEALARRSDVDTVLVSLPPRLHASLASSLVESGKHVLVEKPIDLDPAAARRLVESAERHGVVLSMVSQHRFHDDVVWLRDLAAGGALGRAIAVHAQSLWCRDQKYYEAAPGRGLTDPGEGGVLFNQAVHTVDLLLWIFGPPRSVGASLATLTHSIAVEDTAVVQAVLDNGALATLSGSTSVFPQRSERLEACFEHGTVLLEGGRVTRVDAREGITVEGPPSWRSPAGSIPDKLEPFRRQYRDLIRSIRTGSSPRVTGAEACRVTEFIRAAYASSASGRTVELAAPAEIPAPGAPPGGLAGRAPV